MGLEPPPRDSRVCAHNLQLMMLSALLQRAARLPSHQTTSCVRFFLINAVSTAPFTTGVPNGIPGSGMCSRQSAQRQAHCGPYKAGRAQGPCLLDEDPEQLCPAQPSPGAQESTSQPSWEQSQPHGEHSCPVPSRNCSSGPARAGTRHGQSEGTQKHREGGPGEGTPVPHVPTARSSTDWSRLPCQGCDPASPLCFPCCFLAVGPEALTRAGAPFPVMNTPSFYQILKGVHEGVQGLLCVRVSPF